MTSWVRLGLIFGGLAFVAATIVFYAAVNQADCDVLSAIGPWLVAQTAVAATAGVVTVLKDDDPHPFLTGMATSTTSSLSLWALLILNGIKLLPNQCYDVSDSILTPIGVLFLLSLLLVPIAIGAGALGAGGAAFVVRAFGLRRVP